MTGAAPWPHLPRTNCSTPSPRRGSHFIVFIVIVLLFLFVFFYCTTCVCVCVCVCYLLFIVFGCSRCLGSYHIVHFGCVARFAEFWDEDPAGASRVEGEVIALAQE